jgi:anti-sigma regulatory factor (Ser/Thr protein kinase)
MSPPAWRAAFELPLAESAVPAARRVVAALLQLWQATVRVADAELIISELVTNAIRHAGHSARLELDIAVEADGRVLLGLADGSALKPEIRELTGDQPTGRGMQIVERLAVAWGADDRPDGKRVWAELAMASQRPPPTDPHYPAHPPRSAPPPPRMDDGH